MKQPPDGVRVWVRRHAVDLAVREAEDWAPSAESGGLVLGYWTGPREAVVTHLTMPGSDAIHQRDRFVPDYEHDAARAIEIFASTDHGSVYLGDWHSHPRSNGDLSHRDRKTLANIALSVEAAQSSPLMIIISRPAQMWRVQTWHSRIVSLGPMKWLSAQHVATVPFDADQAGRM